MLQVLVAMLLSFGLSLLVVFTYKRTYAGPSYSQAQAHTLVIMAVVTSVIMIVIGSNIARAFSLIGALSVIRFRSAVKDPRDVAFLYFAMAIGMSSGTGFFAISTTLAIVTCAILFLLARFEVGAKPLTDMILKVVVPSDADFQAALHTPFEQHLASHTLLSAEAIGDGLRELVYTVRLKTTSDDRALLDALEQAEGPQRASLLHGLQQMHV